MIVSSQSGSHVLVVKQRSVFPVEVKETPGSHARKFKQSAWVQHFSRGEKKHDVKLCANCSAPIEKKGGCMHVECERCHSHICWVCGDVFSTGEECTQHLDQYHDGIYGPVGHPNDRCEDDFGQAEDNIEEVEEEAAVVQEGAWNLHMRFRTHTMEQISEQQMVESEKPGVEEQMERTTTLSDVRDDESQPSPDEEVEGDGDLTGDGSLDDEADVLTYEWEESQGHEIHLRRR